ncbi:unnamed protein product [Schistosoma turkestanicum]|nr:unnamed protein product [Schistosoma turkestanicum]
MIAYLFSQEERNNVDTVKNRISPTETTRSSSLVSSSLPASYIIDNRRRSSSREHSSSRRRRKRSRASRYDRGSPSEHVSSSRRKRSSHHSKHKHSSRKHHHRDSHYSDHKHRYRRKHRRRSSTSSTSSSSDTSRESKPSRRGSHNGRNSTQLTSFKDNISSQPKPENRDTATVIPTTGTTTVTNPPPVPSQSATMNLPVQRLTAQDILDKIQKHQQEQAKAQALAAAAAAKLPKYYNPTTVNAVKLAEQQQKRKLLWSKKDSENTSSESKTLWTATSLIAGKGDSAAAAKFRKLMGIHDSSGEVLDGGAANVNETEALRRAEAQAELFRRLEHEYEMSRTITHTQRGAGLGFSSSSHVDYNAYAAMQSEKDKNPNL